MQLKTENSKILMSDNHGQLEETFPDGLTMESSSVTDPTITQNGHKIKLSNLTETRTDQSNKLLTSIQNSSPLLEMIYERRNIQLFI